MNFPTATITILLIIITSLVSTSASAQKKIKPAKTFRDCATCPEMVIIPAGSFVMGAQENEPGSFPEEKPQHKVNVRQFACGKFDITKEQWALFVNETNRPATAGCSWAALPGDTGKPWDPNPNASWNHLGFFQDSSHPAVCITWYDVHDYLNWLSKKTGSVYRLLTEAEWEYATRAGTTTVFYWGDTASHEYANYGTDTMPGVGCAKGRDKWLYTSPVGSFPPNAFGLYDMLGNINQFTEDCFNNSYTGLPQNGSANTSDTPLNLTGELSSMNGTGSCSYRMIRGGNFGDPSTYVRSSSRNWAPVPGLTLKNYSSSALGFRVARTL